MSQNNFNLKSRKPNVKKRRGVAEVISTLLLVVITVVGAVILTSFLDETFVSGSLSVSSGTDAQIKKIKLMAYDTRNGVDLMDPNYSLDNTNTPVVPNVLCRLSCNANQEVTPVNGGSDFLVIQIENRSVNPIYVKNVYLDNVGHLWDSNTFPKDLDTSAADSLGGEFPADGRFSVLSSDFTDISQKDNQIQGGETVNLLVKLDTDNEDIELSKTMRVQLNIGENSLAEFLIETGDAR